MMKLLDHITKLQRDIAVRVQDMAVLSTARRICGDLT